MNEEEDRWQEPKPIMTDKQFVLAIVIAALLFLLIEILHFYYEQNTNKNQVEGQRAYKCLYNSRQ
jgi:hypothetical protein